MRCMPASTGVRPPFLRLQADAAGDDVLPVLSAALGDRHHMIEGQFRGGKDLPAVLTRVVVAGVDIGAGERHVVDRPLDADVPQQANDRGQPEAERDRPDFAVVVLRDDLDLPLAQKRHRFLPVDDLEGLVRRVQEERLLHNYELFSPKRAEAVKRD